MTDLKAVRERVKRMKPMLPAPKDCNGFIAYEADDALFLTKHFLAMLDALLKVKAKEGYCIYGSTNTDGDPDIAFRQGSAQAFYDTAEIANEVLTQLAEEAKEMK